MRLHVAADLTVGDGKGVLQPIGVEAHEFAERSAAAKCANRGGPKEAQSCGRRQAERCCHIDTEDDRLDELASVDRPSVDLCHPLRPRDRDRHHHRHDVRNGRLVDTVELRVVDLVRIAECGGRCRELLSGRPDTRIIAPAPKRLDLSQLSSLRPATPDKTHAEGIEKEGLGGSHGRAWKICVPPLGHVPGEDCDGIHGAGLSDTATRAASRHGLYSAGRSVLTLIVVMWLARNGALERAASG
jgi:hypothetical protein